jgi:hypothetical protein
MLIQDIVPKPFYNFIMHKISMGKRKKRYGFHCWWEGISMRR